MTTFFGPPADAEPGIGPLTFGRFLEESAGSFGDRNAVLWAPASGARIVWTYSRLREQARAVAKALVATGATRGSRVGVLMGSRPEWLAAVWGATMAGGLAVPFNTFAQKPELDHLLRHSDISILLTEAILLDHRFVDDILDLCPEARHAAPGQIHSARYPFVRRVVALDSKPRGAVQSWDDFLAAGKEVSDVLIDGIVRETTPSDDAIIIYSSGTTSLPKGVLHRHRAPLLQIWRHAHREQYVPEDRVYCALPLFWSAGFAAVMGATLASGACLVLTSHFDEEYVLQLIERERLTIVHCGDHHAAQMRVVEENTPHDLSSVRRDVFRFTGPLPPPGSPRPSNRTSYGSTETFTSTTGLPVDAPPDERTTYGRLVAGSSMRILDTQTGEPLGVGQEGEMILKGLTVTRGYVKVSPEHTFDDEGFFHTGDVGWFDERGLLHYTGRITNVIRTNGANVAPLEVEMVLSGHPDVKRAVVIGVPDPVSGELVVACIVADTRANLDVHQIRNFLRGSLSTYKIPSHVLFFSSEEDLPRTGSDKINLPALRVQAAELLGNDA
jgi:fatty-acyl-CoA synthase